MFSGDYAIYSDIDEADVYSQLRIFETAFDPGLAVCYPQRCEPSNATWILLSQGKSFLLPIINYYTFALRRLLRVKSGHRLFDNDNWWILAKLSLLNGCLLIWQRWVSK
jgi:hypothetical protein